MLPCIGPCAVGKHIADTVVGYSLSVIFHEQIIPTAPGASSVAIGHRVGRRAQRAGGVGIFLPVADIDTPLLLGLWGRTRRPPWPYNRLFCIYPLFIHI